jgi:epoxide hydrolase-like predicted phosphatase
MPPSPTLRAAIFDGGGIFSLSADAGGARYWEWRLGLEPGAIRRSITPELNRMANLGILTDEQVWEQALAPYGLDRAQRADLAEDYWAGAYLDYDMAALIERAHAAGYRTALLSNAWRSARASHTALGWDRLLSFDLQMFSAEEGLMKPDAQIYLRCLERLGTNAEETVFIDDTLVNVESARKIGMLAIHYSDKQRDMAAIAQILQLG